MIESKFSENLDKLTKTGIIDWLVHDRFGSGSETIINALASYMFEDKDIWDFTPSCLYVEIYEHIQNSGYDIDWYELISLNFIESIEWATTDIIHTLNYHSYLDDPKNLEKEIMSFITNWCHNCRNKFLATLEDF
jgi:hypothetical protein